jgi:hypothetical protein
VACIGEERKVYMVLVGRPEGRRQLRRLRHRREDGTKMDLWKTGWEDAECIHLVQDKDQGHALVNTVMNLQVLAPQT